MDFVEQQIHGQTDQLDFDSLYDSESESEGESNESGGDSSESISGSS